jgi:hypothetical protein
MADEQSGEMSAAAKAAAERRQKVLAASANRMKTVSVRLIQAAKPDLDI